MNRFNNAFREKKGRYKNRVQLDEIMKKLFYIHNKRPIIDLLNSLYEDNIGYDAEITYLNKEAMEEAVIRKVKLKMQSIMNLVW
ncbi:MAG: hypothetical protein Q8858_16645 [Bacteroidota bacterium]|nr:hypothetical protein [Bacteroidota bacterium]